MIYKTIDYLGRKNPNTKYFDINDDFFKKIDTEEKAYLLGFIAADGSIRKTGFSIYINRRDKILLKKLKDIISVSVPIKNKSFNLVGFTINSQTISKDLMSLFQLFTFNKSKTIKFPDIKDELKYHFIRGLFDGDGNIRKPSIGRTVDCKISSSSTEMMKHIKDFCKIPCRTSNEEITWSGNNALDFLGKIYEEANIFLERKELFYRLWAEFKPCDFYGKRVKEKSSFIFKWKRVNKKAVAPFKENVSDSGYDLTLIEKIKDVGKVSFFDTGIAVQPEFGYYFDLVPRSSISKTGYILANNVGIIDRTYQGTIIVPLMKVDENAKDIKLPSRMVQIIPREIIHAEFVLVNDFDITKRGSGGFGSTGQ